MIRFQTWLHNLKITWPHLPLLLVIIFYCIYHLSLFTGLAGMGGDGVLFFYPAEHHLGEALRSGTLPFWSTKIQAGFPLFADGQPGALYPFNLIAFGLLPTPIAHNVTLFFHGLLGLLFCYLWAKKIELSEEASAGVAFIFTFTSPLLGSNVPYLETLAWLPCLFWLSERMIQHHRPAAGNVIAICVAVACQWLAGFPQISFYTLIAVTVYVYGRLWVIPSNLYQRFKLLLQWGSAVVIGLALAAPQLLPTIELTQFSIRNSGISGSMAGEGSLFPGTLMTLLFPGWKLLLNSMGFGQGIYLGIIPLLLILLTFFHYKSTKNPYLFPIVLTSLVALFFALGRYNPAFGITRELPGFSSFRYPSRFLDMAQLSLIVVAGMGWDRFKQLPTSASKWIYRFLFGGVLIYVLVSALGVPTLQIYEDALLKLGQGYVARTIVNDPYHLQSDSYYSDKIQQIYDQLLDSMKLTNRNVLIPFLVLLVGGLTFYHWGNGPFLKVVWVVLITPDVWSWRGWMRSVEPVTIVTQPPASTLLIRSNQVEGELCRVFWLVDEESMVFDKEGLSLLPANYNSIFGLESTGLYSPLGFVEYYSMLENVGTVNLAFGHRVVTGTAVSEEQPFLSFLNVCFLLSRQPLAGYTLLGQADGVYVYSNERVRPRAFLVDQLHIEPDDQRRYAWLREQVSQLDTVVVLDRSLPEFEPPPISRANQATLNLVHYQPAYVEYTVDVEDSPVILVLTDTHYPGWRVRVNTIERELLRVNGVFRGVVVPPGSHTVQFEYIPTSFYQGTAVALSSGLLLILWLGFNAYKKRKSRPVS